MYDYMSDEQLIQNIQYKLDELSDKLDADTANRLVNLAQELMYRANLYEKLLDDE